MASFLAEDSPETSDRLVQNAFRTFAYLAENPRVGRLWESSRKELAGLRYWPVDGFPNHFVYYKVGRLGVEVVRIYHAKRDHIPLLDD